jgi:hypothetical protein
MVGMFQFSDYWRTVSLILEVTLYDNGFLHYVKVMDADGSVRIHGTELCERDRIFLLIEK